ncbi:MULTISPECIES: hypothetical protein [unclassified Dietzia]|uniref:hypothetical protein n=1 Tax=unclassified Dietzia TaxID=2617939 RepID=UPI000D2034EE|nr:MULTISPECIES: hypothetical protein [unclassified Dietzia]AVZ39079.1 hypothetical protein CT688_05940 [Dietzia sp. JS16-p6b]QGW24266.1 hypothetical protein GJR88_01895 [Dietzia sp. DQ12-45-1b]
MIDIADDGEPSRSTPQKLPAQHSRNTLDDAVKRAYEAGYGRNQIAEALGVGGGTVSRAAVRLGLKFDGTQTAQATASRVESARFNLASTLSEVAELGARRMLVEIQADVIDPSVLKAVSIATGIAIDKLAVIAEQLPAPQDDFESAHAFMENFTYGIFEEYHRTHPDAGAIEEWGDEHVATDGIEPWDAD